MAQKEWQNVTVPFEFYRAGTRGGAVIFQIEGGEYDGYSFARPLLTVRRSFDKGKPGFQLGYTVEQQFDAQGDLVGEDSEILKLKKTRKNDDGKWVTDDETEIPMDELELYI